MEYTSIMKTKIFLPLAVILLLLSSCSGSLVEMNNNPNALTHLDNEYLFANAIKTTFGNAQNHRKLMLFFGAQYSHCYVVPHNTGRPHDQYRDQLYTDDYMEVVRRSFADPIRLINVVRLETQEGPGKNELRHAMANVVAICNYTRITDLYGDIPYTEGGWGNTGQLLPRYDAQEFIYKSMMDTLKAAIEIIRNGDPEKAYPGFDPLYDNELEYWARFANSFRLRLAMRARFADPAYCEQVIRECLEEDLIETNEQGARLFSLNDQYHYNAWSETYKVMPWKISKKLVDWLIDSHDPRLTYWVAPNINGEYKGLENGLDELVFSSVDWDEISGPAEGLYSATMPVDFLNAAEVWLNRAEAELVLDGPHANDYYQQAIRLAMEQWQIPEDSIDRFINEAPEATLFGDKENMLRQIGTQKWLALLPNFTESYSEIRRLGYPVIPKRTASYLDKGVTDGVLPKRFLYPNEEISLNEKNVMEAIARQGPNKITTPVWWDVRDID